jgi:hypothetical protein
MIRREKAQMIRREKVQMIRREKVRTWHLIPGTGIMLAGMRKCL